jgi:membrane protease YdiL (CAAX protease family)
LRPAAATDLVNLGAVEALAFTLCTFALLRIHAPGRNARVALGLRPTHPGLALVGIAQGVVLQVPAGSLRDLVERYAPTSDEVLRSRAVLLSADSWGELLAVLLVTACLAPLVEELFARGAVYGALCRSHPLAGAAAVTALCFVLLHPEWRNWPSLLLVAGTLAHLRLASGSLLPCVALHVAFNAATIVALFTGVSSVTRPLQFSWAATVTGWIAMAGLVWVAQRVAQRSEAAAWARAEDIR